MEVLGRAAIVCAVWSLAACAGESSAIHILHAQKLGRLECNLCHPPAARGSVDLKRPGHAQCSLCHAEAFQSAAGPVCAPCHNSSKPAASDLTSPVPASLSRFSHAHHADPKARTTPSGFRGDCAFCHGTEPRIPGHKQCAVCHGKSGIQPELTPFLRTAGCLGCHDPQSSAAPVRPLQYSGIRFSHAPHVNAGIDCSRCHAAAVVSASLNERSLPRMADCAECHDGRQVAAHFRMSHCETCHTTAMPEKQVLHPDVKPPSHTPAFRRLHASAAASADTKCFACHQNVRAGSGSAEVCSSCHLTMKPVSHTARWKDDIHGKWAALDRTACATCHTADYCSRCHNQLPRSHAPLPMFKAGGHARLAMLDNRACFTCHTFQNTCASCHVRTR